MRTIKRKRIFGGRKSLHKSKHKKSLKKLRGGKIPQADTVIKIAGLPGIIGVYKTIPLYVFPSEEEVIYIPKTETPNLFKGNINKINDSIILSDYKPLYSIKVGWIYGSHFGNLTMYSTAGTDSYNSLYTEIKKLYLIRDKKLTETFFIPPIDDKITNMITPKISKLTPRNELTPWGNKMNYEIELTKEDLTIADSISIDKTFKNIMNKYYEGVIDGMNGNKIETLTDVQGPGDADSILSEYNKNIHIRNKNFSDNNFNLTNNDITATLNNLKWGDNKDNNSYKCINKLRQRQEVIFKEITDIFSEYESTAGEIITIPFNIEYFQYSIQGEKPPCQVFIERYRSSIDNDLVPKINHYVWFSLSNIMYSLKLMGLLTNNSIYMKKEKLFRFKSINSDDYFSDPTGLIPFTPTDDVNGYRDFLYKYNINSLIDPKILSKLLAINIHIKATILLTCNIDEEGKLVKIDKERNTDMYNKIDDKRFMIKKLTIDGVSIEEKDMDEGKLTDIAKKIESGKGGAITCDISVETDKEPTDITLQCNYDYIEKEGSEANKKNIMIYLFDEGEFKHELINATFTKDVFNDSIYDAITEDKIQKYVETLNNPTSEDAGHSHHYYNLVL